jgi:hypothetical protein
VKGMITHSAPSKLVTVACESALTGVTHVLAGARRCSVSRLILEYRPIMICLHSHLPTPCTAATQRKKTQQRVVQTLHPSSSRHRSLRHVKSGTARKLKSAIIFTTLVRLFLPSWPAKPVLKQRQPAQTRRLTAVTGAVVQGLTLASATSEEDKGVASAFCAVSLTELVWWWRRRRKGRRCSHLCVDESQPRTGHLKICFFWTEVPSVLGARHVRSCRPLRKRELEPWKNADGGSWPPQISK